MRTFLRDHWKTIVAIILLVLLALVTTNPGAAPIPTPSLTLRLQAHADALTARRCPPTARLRHAAAYIDGVLEETGYAVHARTEGSARIIEAAVANVVPGANPERIFIIGARYDGAGSDDARTNTASTAAVLELARLLAPVRPTRGTEIRFVFLLGPDRAQTPTAADIDDSSDGDSSGFIAYAGTPATARRVQDALAAFQSVAHLGMRGLATPAYMQGVTLTNHATGAAAASTLVVTDTTFTRFPYRLGADDTPEQRINTGVARVVDSLARALAELAGGKQT